MNLWTRFVIAVVAFFSLISADKLLLEKKILNDIFKNYYRELLPNEINGTYEGPVVVEIDAHIRSIDHMDDSKMSFMVRLTLRQRWQDKRLKYDNESLEYITLEDPQRLWIPDLYFANEMKGHSHNILVRIYPDGHVLYSTRLSLELYCPMDLRNYPMDKQMCNIRVRSYGYTTEDIIFRWKEEDPVQISNPILMHKFTLNRFYNEDCTIQLSSGPLTCIVINFQFTRVFTSYLLHVFIPTMLLVISSWITFWLNPRSSYIRLVICIGVLFSMILVTIFVAKNTPRASYIKAIDVWMGACIVFIFCVLIELALVNNVITKEDSETGERDETDKGMDIDDEFNENYRKLCIYFTSHLNCLNKHMTQAQKIDTVSRFLFPAAFTIFNFVYWFIYTSK